VLRVSGRHTPFTSALIQTISSPRRNPLPSRFLRLSSTWSLLFCSVLYSRNPWAYAYVVRLLQNDSTPRLSHRLAQAIRIMIDYGEGNCNLLFHHLLLLLHFDIMSYLFVFLPPSSVLCFLSTKTEIK